MSPRWLYWPTPVSGATQLVRATYSGGGSNQTVGSTNIIGTSLWDGRGFSQVFFVVSQNRIDFYFANDTDRDTALAAFSNWTWVDEDASVSFNCLAESETSSRIKWTGTGGDTISLISGNTYRLDGS